MINLPSPTGLCDPHGLKIGNVVRMNAYGYPLIVTHVSSQAVVFKPAAETQPGVFQSYSEFELIVGKHRVNEVITERVQ